MLGASESGSFVSEGPFDHTISLTFYKRRHLDGLADRATSRSATDAELKHSRLRDSCYFALPSAQNLTQTGFLCAGPTQDFAVREYLNDGPLWGALGTLVHDHNPITRSEHG